MYIGTYCGKSKVFQLKHHKLHVPVVPCMFMLRVTPDENILICQDSASLRNYYCGYMQQFLHYFVVYTGHRHFMPFPPAAQPSVQRF